ncbi:acyl carrier protein [Myxococcota bacterium]
MADATTISDIIREFVVREFFAGQMPSSLRPDVSLITTGVIDSVGTMRLVLFLEERFCVRIESEEIRLGALDSLAAMASLVECKRCG